MPIEQSNKNARIETFKWGFFDSQVWLGEWRKDGVKEKFWHLRDGAFIPTPYVRFERSEKAA